VTVIRHVIFRGRVQGVGFRAFVQSEARRRNVEGWVRNRRDGTVEAVFSGPADAVDALIAATRTGLNHARVDAVDQPDATAGELALRGSEAFAVLPTV
jgi:acylphosphatase